MAGVWAIRTVKYNWATKGACKKICVNLLHGKMPKDVIETLLDEELTDQAVIGQATHSYAVIMDPTHWPFFHIRIWQGNRIMMVTPGMRPGEEAEMAYQVYATQGRVWEEEES